jgi:anti-sigma B factor antagonist
MEIIKSALSDGTIIKVEIGLEKSTDNALSGSVELDIENQANFVEMINTIFEDGKTKIIVDMSNISYIDSSGLWALFEGHKKATQKEGTMVLLNPTKDVRRVLDITKMSSKMKIVASENEAIECISV